MTLLLVFDDAQNLIADLAVGGAAAQEISQVVIVLAEEARAKFPVGREDVYKRQVRGSGPPLRLE